MGVQGLLEFLKKATKSFHISEFKGATAAIDASSWIAKGISQGIPLEKLPEFCLRHVALLQSHDIRPILVFNGKSLSVLELRKRDAKKQYPSIGGQSGLDEPFFKITMELAIPLIRKCHEANIDCLVAPYEVAAQLAFFNLRGIAELVITENPDLTLFGCSKIGLNMNIYGHGVLLDSEKICDAINLRPDSQMFDKFKHMCILAGCDYLEPLEGIDLAVAHRFISNIEDPNPETFLDSIPSVLNIPKLQITEDYKQKFMMTDAIFRHQIIYDPFTKKREPLFDPHIAGTNPAYCKYTGEIYDQKKSYQLALGNMHPCSFEVIGNWDPKKANLTNKSIWGNGPYERSPSRSQQKDSFKEYFSNYKFETIQESDMDEANRTEEEKANQRNLDLVKTDMPSGTRRFPSRQPPFSLPGKNQFGQTSMPMPQTTMPQTTMPTRFQMRPASFDVSTRFPSPHIPTVMPGYQTKMPGIQTTMPGVQTTMPGIQTTMPGVQTTMPGIQTRMPGIQTRMPGFQNPIPQFGQVPMPGLKRLFPKSLRSDNDEPPPRVYTGLPALVLFKKDEEAKKDDETKKDEEADEGTKKHEEMNKDDEMKRDKEMKKDEEMKKEEEVKKDGSSAAGTSQDISQDTARSPMDYVEVIYDKNTSDQGKDKSTKETEN